MPTFKTAKEIAENALKTIGAFPASRSQADAGELQRALEWLEMVLNTKAGLNTMTSFARIIEIPLEADVGDYLLSDYDDDAGTQHVFGASLVNSTNGSPIPLLMQYENDVIQYDFSETGSPCKVIVTRSKDPVLKVFPLPVQSNEDAGEVIRLSIQTYHPSIDKAGTGAEDIDLRPSWYLWCTKRTAYEVGCGPVRKLGREELDRLKNDAQDLEDRLLARDGQYNTGKPPTTEPMAGWDY